MNPLARKILQASERPSVRLAYGVMASATTVLIEGSSVAVTAPVLQSAGKLETGDYVALQIAGADALIIGRAVAAGSSQWTTFAPSWVNLTLGDGTTNGIYRYTPGGMSVHARLTLGSTSSITGGLQLTLPNSETSLASSVAYLGSVFVNDTSGGAEFTGVSRSFQGATNVALYSNGDIVSAANPMTAATGDIYEVSIFVPLD